MVLFIHLFILFNEWSVTYTIYLVKKLEASLLVKKNFFKFYKFYSTSSNSIM